MYFSSWGRVGRRIRAIAEHRADHAERGNDEDRDGQILPVELGHDAAPGPAGEGSPRSIRVAFSPERNGRRGFARCALASPTRDISQQVTAAARPMYPEWEHGCRSPPEAGRPRRRGPPELPRTAFVLSGGGNQGVSQVGMLRALLERGIVPDVVIGTSAGALNGAGDLLRAQPHRGRAARGGVGAAALPTTCFPGGKIHRAWNVVRRGTHLFGSEGLEALIQHTHAGPLVR